MLANTVQQLVQTQAQAQAQPTPAPAAVKATKSYLKKPQKFKGGNSEAVHVFKHAFRVWAESEKDWFTETDATGVVQHNPDGSLTVEPHKMILSALSMMEGPAAEWAQIYLETANNLDAAKHPFSNFSGTEFWKAFETK